MEKILDENERIKRAEELYFRRNNKEVSFQGSKANKSYYGMKNKLLFHLLLMFNIFVLVFVIQNKDYVFSNDFNNQINEWMLKLSNYVKSMVYEIEKEENKNTVENDSEILNEKNETGIVSNEDIQDDENKINEIQSSSASLMEEDVKNLKNIYKFVNPISGVISSEFGARESKYQNVRGYHTGIDVASETGTPIVASMEGIVEEVSSYGDYGNHLKIRCNNVTTLYAHCSEIFVKKGQIVGMGQLIAAVGSTGNSTGPHLHFEIRIDDRFVDPGKVIKF